MKFKVFTFRIAEMAMSIGAVLVFFLLFVGILSLSFPKGSGLRDLLAFEDPTDLSGHTGMDLDLGGDVPGTVTLVARLTEVSRRVKDKRANSISWQDAHTGIPLENRHAVQTFSRSGAKIAFDDNNSLDLGENSLVIIRRLEQTSDLREKRASLVILDGELRGTIGEGRDDTMELEIVTAGAVSKIRSAGSEETEFKIVTHDDNSSSIAIFSGSAHVTAGGRTLVIEANQVVGVTETGKFLPPVRIPAAPALTSPMTRAEYTYSAVPPDVRLRWEPVDAADEYHVQIARDANFDSLVLDTLVPAPELSHANLESGRYFWRVNARNQSVDGLAGPSRIFDITRDVEPPSLEVSLPGPVLNADRFRLRGVTEPGAQVFVGALTIPTSQSGEFEYELSLEPGPNVLVVEAFDPAGNVAYVSQLVHAKFQVNP